MTKAIKRIALLAVFAVSALPASAGMYSEGGYTVAARAGIAPATFSKDVTQASAVVAGSALGAGVAWTSETGNFHGFYNLPFTAGLDLGYFVQDGLEVFANFDFATAKAKESHETFMLAGAVISYPKAINDNYRSYAGYLGMRNYFCTDDCFVPFVGAKIGAAKYDQGKTNFAAGVQLGFDYKVAENTALTFMSEAIITTGTRFDNDVKVGVSHSPITHVHASAISDPKTQYSFPITLGVRFKI